MLPLHRSNRVVLPIVALVWIIVAPLCARAEDAVVRSFAAGSGPDAVGMVDAPEDNDDDDMNGPQALYAGDKGEIYVLDQVNGRVLQFEPREPRATTRSLSLPKEIVPSDMIVRKNAIYVWDGRIHALQATGPEGSPTRGLSVTRSLAAPDPGTLTAFNQMGTGAAEAGDNPADLLSGPTRSIGDAKARPRRSQSVDTRGRGPLDVETVPVDAATVLLDVEPKNGAKPLVRLRVKVRDRLGSAELLEVDGEGRFFVLAENIPSNSDAQASAYVARFSPTGILQGAYELPLASAAMISRRFVAVSPGGDVYFLRTRKGGTDILGVGFRPARVAGIIDGGIRPVTEVPFPPVPFRFPAIKGASVAVGPLSRLRILQTAFAFEQVDWQVSSGAYGPDPDAACSGYQRIRRPWYLEGQLNERVRGVPYCWGCMGSLSQVMSRINRGMLAGNVCTRDNPRPSETAGVDCSGFVSAAWGLSTHFTTIAIPTIARRLENPWDLQPGDALDKPGSHVMLFLRFTPDRRAEVLEAATGGCGGKVCRNVHPLASLLARGYLPMRFKALAETASQ